MRQVEIYYDHTWYTYRWLKALYVSKNEFKKHGINIVFKGPSKFFPKMEKIFKPLTTKEDYIRAFSRQHDIVFLAYHHPIGITGFSTEDRCDVLKTLKKNANKVIWMDTADSPNTNLFDVLPYVDKFLKKQVFRNLDNYGHDLYGDRLYTEYYHLTAGVEDTKASPTLSYLSKENYGKIGVSWNIGLADIFSYDRWKRIIQFNRFADIEPVPVYVEKIYDVAYRGNAGVGIYGYQRNVTLDYLKHKCKFKTVDYSINPFGKEYREELKKSKIVVSPFGYGEICLRDFEATVFGAALLKPSVEHIMTYPMWYIENETYIPFEWNFSNIDEKIELLLKDEFYKRIADNAQRQYIQYYTGNKKAEFAKHLIEQIGLT